MGRISTRFSELAKLGRKALIPYITCGDPEPGMTVPLMHALVANGADLIELGVPFSDPMADGPTIQRASEWALARGVSLRDVLELVRQFRDRDEITPVVLMGYANPIEAMGIESFVQAAKASGVDGVLVVDYPPEECTDFVELSRKVGLDNIFLLAPTSTPERIDAVGRLGSGYLYYVSLRGVTGAGHIDLDEVSARIPLIRERVQRPVGVGFGIRDASGAARVARVADAVVIGSRIIEEIERDPGAACDNVGRFVASVRVAMDAVRGERER